jgi:outer membrane protein OmpA-like peptidoglycan-associated protein
MKKRVFFLALLFLSMQMMGCSALKLFKNNSSDNSYHHSTSIYDCNKELDLFGGTYYLKVNTFHIVLDSSISMSDPYMGISKHSIAIDLLKRMNEMIPDISIAQEFDPDAQEQMTAGLRTFGHHDALFKGSTSLVSDLLPYSRNRFAQLFSQLQMPYGESPLDKAIHESIVDIKAALKKLKYTQKDDTALIIISDFEALDKSYQEAMIKLVQSFEKRIQIYPILIGNNRFATSELKEFASSCPTIHLTHQQELSGDDELYAFVKDIFLTDQKPDRSKDNTGNDGDESDKISPPGGIRVGDYILKKSILFDLNSFEVKSDYHGILTKAVNEFFVNTDACYEIEGHTDRTGPVEFNMRLSKKRAQSVYNYIKNQLKEKLSKEAYSNKIIIKGYGSEHSLLKHIKIQKNPEDRRVQIRKVSCEK